MARVQIPSRVFAALYDKLNAGAEAAGVAELRREVLSEATGATLEIGAGTGLNVQHYPVAVTRLVLAEPDPQMRARLEAKVAESGREATLASACAEHIDAEDAAFDTAVCTLVLCTVPDPSVALAEISRVLKPGGRLLFIEHVRSERPRIARLQDLVRPLYKVVGRGCNPNRDTLASIREAGFEIDSHRREIAPKTPPTENELLVGSARRPAPPTAT